MEIKILSPKKTLFKGRAESVTLPGKQGEFQILKDHATIFSLLGRGQISIDKNKKIPISQGILEARDNKITILIKN